MKRTAVIRLQLPSEKLSEILLKALLPETKRSSRSRSRVSVEGKSTELTLRIEAKDTSALRAAINSYLRWVVLIRDTYSTTVGLENTSGENT